MTGDDLAEKVAAVLWGKFGAEDHSPLAAWLTEQDCRRMAAALLPLIREREAAAWERALREAAEDVDRLAASLPSGWRPLDPSVSEWLRDRAAANPYAGSEGDDE